MNTNYEAPLAVIGKPQAVGWRPRAAALLALAATVSVVFAGARAVYYAATDAWMAPLILTPDNDQILQINVKLNEQLVEREKLGADVERIDADIKGIDSAIGRLQPLRTNGAEALKWSAFATNAQSTAAGVRVRFLTEQRKLLAEMLTRQTGFASATERNVEAGLVSKQELEHEAQVVDQLRLALSQNLRDAAEARSLYAQSTAAASVIRDAMSSEAPHGGLGLLPEVASGQEREARIELELIRLDAERRALATQRRITIESIERMDEILKQLQARPIYRAVSAKTDVGFVPYTQLQDLTTGADVVACRYVVFGCKIVGRVTEIVPGEVVAQDPWAQIARGQYVILDLAEHEAAQEKALRGRNKR